MMIEQKVASQILEDTVKVTLAGKTYDVVPPTFATYLRVSELVNSLPDNDLSGKEEITNDDILATLHRASEYKAIPTILATLIIGEQRKNSLKSFARQLLFKKDRITHLAEEITYTASISNIKEALAIIIAKMDLSDFFVLTTFLKGINIAKSTREVEKKTN